LKTKSPAEKRAMAESPRVADMIRAMRPEVAVDVDALLADLESNDVPPPAAPEPEAGKRKGGKRRAA
jgi:hypothetical protein